MEQVILNTETLETAHCGLVEFNAGQVLVFPAGLAGFPENTQYLLLSRPDLVPLLFLQSVEKPTLSFPLIGLEILAPDYDLLLSSDDRRRLRPGKQDGNGVQSCFAIVCVPASGRATANLLGPVVIDWETRRGVQAIRDDNRYSATHPLPEELC